ncbi:MAG: alkaline phosphatase family protein [Balneolales bacterium]
MLSKSTLILFSFVFLFSCSSPDQEVEKEKKVIFVLLDGISADILEMIDTPHLDEISRRGGYTHAYVGGEAGGYSESPTVSAVGYNHLLTGTWSNKHNVYGNSIEDPNYNYWSIFRLLKDQNPEKKVAVFSSWIDNRTKLIGDGLPESGINMDYHFDGFDTDTLNFPHDDGGEYVFDIDEHVSKGAGSYIKSNAPDLSWMYLWYPDNTGHRYGDGDIYYESVRNADDQIGRVWEAVKQREQEHNEEWLIVVTTDHGRSIETGKGHGGHTERERTTWIVSSHPDHNQYFTVSKPGVVDIYPTIARFMDIEIPESLNKELDGVPLIGDVSISEPYAELDQENQELSLSWNAWNEDDEMKIWLSTTNTFKTGGEDEYHLLKEVPIVERRTKVDISDYPSGFYKIIFEAPHNTVNRWVVVP